jgi:hypothetical protein
MAANTEVPGFITGATRFLSSNGSETGSIQPHEDNEELLERKVVAPV